MAAVETEALSQIDTWSNQTSQLSEVLLQFERDVLPEDLKPRACLAIGDLRQLAQNLMAVAVTLSDEEECFAKAMRRVTLGEAPAQKGAQAKDCLVVEHMLAAMEIVRREGRLPGVFLSSNTKDYRESSAGSQLRAPLESQFQGVSLTFCTNWAWAETQLAV